MNMHFDKNDREPNFSCTKIIPDYTKLLSPEYGHDFYSLAHSEKFQFPYPVLETINSLEPVLASDLSLQTFFYQMALTETINPTPQINHAFLTPDADKLGYYFNLLLHMDFALFSLFYDKKPIGFQCFNRAGSIKERFDRFIAGDGVNPVSVNPGGVKPRGVNPVLNRLYNKFLEAFHYEETNTIAYYAIDPKTCTPSGPVDPLFQEPLALSEKNWQIRDNLCIRVDYGRTGGRAVVPQSHCRL